MSVLAALLNLLHKGFSSPSQSRCACACAYDVQHMKSNTWLTCDLCCLQMDHALSLAVRYAPMQYHVSAVHSFRNRHSMYYCWNMLTAQGSQQQTLWIGCRASVAHPPHPAGNGDLQTPAVDTERLYPGATAWVDAGTMADGTTRAYAGNQRYVAVLPSAGCAKQHMNFTCCFGMTLLALLGGLLGVMFACICTGGLAACAALHNPFCAPCFSLHRFKKVF